MKIGTVSLGENGPKLQFRETFTAASKMKWHVFLRISEICSKSWLKCVKNVVFGRIMACPGRLSPSKWRTPNQIAALPLVSQRGGRATNSLWRRGWCSGPPMHKSNSEWQSSNNISPPKLTQTNCPAAAVTSFPVGSSFCGFGYTFL